jgi:peptide maturation system protein (TIGR04066 family)
MNKKADTILYPVTYEVAPLLRNSELIPELDTIKALAPAGSAYTSLDLNCVDYGGETGIVIGNNYEESLSMCQRIIFSEICTDKYFALDYKKFIRKKIEQAVKAGKNIICLLELNKTEQEELEQMSFTSHADFSYLGPEYIYTDYSNLACEEEKIYEITTPVIFVLGLSENCNKFEVQLKLRKQLLTRGYKVAQVGTKSYCRLFDFHSIPQFMLGKSLTEGQKITLFNHFIKNIEITEQPDVIIVGIPGGCMPFNMNITNHYGITAYEISHAISPDATVFCLLYDNYTPEYLTELQNIIKYKFGIEIDCYHLGNNFFEWPDAIQLKAKKFSLVDFSTVEKRKNELNSLNNQLLNIYNPDDEKLLADILIDNLNSYGFAQII